MTLRQIKFANEYLVSGNASEAAVKAGYSEKTAYSIGQRLLKNVELRAYLDERLAQMSGEKLAEAGEVLQYLSAVMRGETTSKVLALCGDGCQEVIEKGPDERERLKAAELLGKRYGLFTDKVNVEGVPQVVFVGDAPD